MRTNIEIDDALMTRAMKASGLKTKKAVVAEALQTLVRLKAQTSIRELFGTVKFAPGYDYKKMRRSRLP